MHPTWILRNDNTLRSKMFNLLRPDISFVSLAWDMSLWSQEPYSTMLKRRLHGTFSKNKINIFE